MQYTFNISSVSFVTVCGQPVFSYRRKLRVINNRVRALGAQLCYEVRGQEN